MYLQKRTTITLIRVRRCDFVACMHQHQVFWLRSLYARKPVFGVCEKARLKPANSATETSWEIAISLVSSLDMILLQSAKNKYADQTARIRRLVCTNVQAGLRLCCLQTAKDRFSPDEAHMICAKTNTCQKFYNKDIEKMRRCTGYSVPMFSSDFFPSFHIYIWEVTLIIS